MPSALDRLIGLALVGIEGAMASPRWDREMERVIRTAHTAAWLTATAERLGVRDPGLLKRPTRAERADIDAAVRRQLEYLKGFVQARGGMSDAAALARARLYGPAVKSFYYAQRWGGWEIPDQLIPGNQQCKGNCLCSIAVKDNGDGTGVLTRVMGGTEHHCSECPPLAGDHPVRRKGAAVKAWRWAWSGWAVKHGSHDQSSHGRRRGGRGGYRGGSGGTRVAPSRLRGATAAPLTSDSTALPVQRFSDPADADAAMRQQGLARERDMSQAEANSLQWYQSSGHERINAHLRGLETDRNPGEIERASANLDAVMGRSRLQSNVEVHRGMLVYTSEAEALFAQWQPGATFRDPGYLSTTFDPRVAHNFGAEYGVEVRIRVPAGTPAIYMPQARPLSGVANEYELLLGRGLNYRVISRADGPDGRSSVELEIVP